MGDLIGICVVNKTKDFTLFEDYKITNMTVVSDAGQVWHLEDRGDGYLGCTTAEGFDVEFSV